MRRNDLAPDVYIYTSLINGHMRQDAWDKAEAGLAGNNVDGDSCQSQGQWVCDSTFRNSFFEQTAINLPVVVGTDFTYSTYTSPYYHRTYQSRQYYDFLSLLYNNSGSTALRSYSALWGDHSTSSSSSSSNSHVYTYTSFMRGMDNQAYRNMVARHVKPTPVNVCSISAGSYFCP